MGYSGGVRLNKFIDPESLGTFEGFQLKGKGTMAIELPNHIPTAHDGWLDTKIEFLVQEGSLAPWSTVVEPKVQPRSRKCLPLGVEPNNLRVIWDARFLNCMCEHFSFQMDGLGKVAQCSWKGAQQAIL